MPISGLSETVSFLDASRLHHPTPVSVRPIPGAAWLT